VFHPLWWLEMDEEDYEGYWEEPEEPANDDPMQVYTLGDNSDSDDLYPPDEEIYMEGYTEGYYAADDEEYDDACYADDMPQMEQPNSPSNLFTNTPGPGMIVIAAITMCLVMAVGLLAISSSVTLPAVAEIAPAAATQVPAPAAEQPPALPDGNEAAIPADCTVSDLFPNKVRRWCGLITQYATKHGLSPDLVAAVIWLESGGNATAYSRSGAVGLMQVMPSDGIAATFTCINGPCFSDRPTSAQLEDPEFNIAYGTRMLSGLVRKNGGLREALKSYGPMDAGYSYADKVLGIFQQHTK